MAEGDGSDPIKGAQTPASEATAASTPASAVFISYASRDAAVAGALVEALERHGISCWIAPRDVDVGALYAEAIIRAISGASALILVLSASAVGSSHVGKEVERASSKKRPIFALRIDAAPLTPALEYFLSESQWVEAQAGTLDAAYAKLIGAIRKSVPTASEIVPPLTLSAGKTAPAHPKWRRNRMLLAAGLAVVALALGALLADKFWLAKHVATIKPTTAATGVVGDKSIAVLPFADMSEKKDQEYFADGMAEEILDLLARIPGLTVIGRTSSFQFKGKSDDLRTIGAKLSAAYILEGSVRKSGDRLRVTAQLIDSQSGTHLWSDTYDRDMTDVLKLQDEIASGIVRAMEVTVGADQLRQRTSIKNMDAYQFYLRGRHAFDRYDRDGDDEAAANFKKALDLDPAFAEAAVYLALTRTQQAIDGFIDYAGGFEEARRIAENALRIDPSLAIGHCALADYYTRLAWDWPAADWQAKRAVELDPGGVIPLDVAAVLATSLGHWDEAVGLLNAAIEFDPLNAGLYWDLGNARYRSGRYTEAEAAFRRALQIAPTMISAHFELGRVLLEAGHLRDALDEMERESPEPYSGRTLGLAMVYYALGRRTDSDAAVKRLAAEGGDDWPFGMAEAYAYRGEADKAIHWLDRAYTTKDELQYIKGDPTFRKIEGDPRFKAFLRKMNLTE